MGLMDNLNQRIKRVNILDVKLAQGTAMFFTLIIVKLIPRIMTINIWWFVGLMILCAIRPFYVFWIK